MAAIASSLLLPIARDDEGLFGSVREDIFGLSRSISCFALKRGYVQVWPLYLSFDEDQAVICNPPYSGR